MSRLLTSDSCFAVLSDCDGFFAGKDARAEMAGLLRLVAMRQREVGDDHAENHGSMHIDVSSAVSLGFDAVLSHSVQEALNAATGILCHAEHVIAALDPHVADVVCRQAVHNAAEVLYRALRDSERHAGDLARVAHYTTRSPSGLMN